ncbi:MAG: hypothetical protein NVSMB2_20680 [Chloroflexota bacterium]
MLRVSSEDELSGALPSLDEIQRVLAKIDDPLALLAGFFDYAPAAFQVYGVDGHSLLVNSAFRRMFGSVPPPEYNVLADEIAERAGVLDQIRRAFQGEIVRTPPVWYDPRELNQVHMAEGRRIAMEATFFPLRNAEGAVDHVAIAFRDVTVEQMAAERVQAEQTRLQFLADASAALGESLDYHATINHAARLAVPRFADMCTVDLLVDGSPERLAEAQTDAARAAGLYVEAPLGQSVHTTETAIVVPLVARGTVHGAISFLYGPSGRQYTASDVPFAEEVARRVANAIDNADLYRQAQDAIRARDEFLSIASHELRNPVAGISGASQLLRRTRDRGTLDADRLNGILSTIERSASHLARLTEDLLDVSRLQQGRLPLRLQAVNMADLVRDVVAQQRDVQPIPAVTLDVACDACVVRADPDRIEQVLSNLLDNAAKYSVTGEPIDVVLTREGDGVRVTVRDRGIGFAAGMAIRIFEPFGRASNALDRNIPGLGLGLYIGRRIAEQHGGRLWAESAGEGQGTAVSLWLAQS